MLHRIRFALLLAFVVASAAHAQTKGQRVYFSGHSFHYIMPAVLADIAKKAEIKDYTPLGLSQIGGSRVHQHWAPPVTIVPKTAAETKLPADMIAVASTARFAPSGEITVTTDAGDTMITYTGIKGNTFIGCKGGNGTIKAGAKVTSATNAIRETLKSSNVDVLTMAPIYLPDDGIDKFVKLAVEKNPKIRIFVQENWLPFDLYDVTFQMRPAKVDHNAPTIDALRKMHAPYFASIDEHVAELNKKYNTTAVHVAPAGQAVIKLRERIVAGKAPGLKEQSDLFGDAIGHAKAPLQAQLAYVYYALIFEKSPVGVPVPAVLGKGKDVEQLNRVLQEIAWEAVTAHPQSGVKAK